MSDLGRGKRDVPGTGYNQRFSIDGALGLPSSKLLRDRTQFIKLVSKTEKAV
jgi:hypothetical protein